MTDLGVDDDLDVDFEDETRWLFLEGEGSHDAYRDLERFIATIADHDLAARLGHARRWLADHGYEARPARRNDLP